MANENDRACVYAEISDERRAQDAQWGGEEHDDGHAPTDWMRFIEHQIEKAPATSRDDHYQAMRERLVKIAALAVAGIESIDRTLDA